MATEIQLPLDQMTVAEKLEVIDAVWNDLLKTDFEIPVPEWHVEELDRAEKAVADGRDEFIDLDEFEALVLEKTGQAKTSLR